MTPSPSTHHLWSDWTQAIAAALGSVPDSALLRAAEVLREASVVVTAGNGGSAALASHAAQAIAKPDYSPGRGRPAVCVTDHTSILSAFANDVSWQDALTEAARHHLELDGAVVLVISSSGRSSNVCRLAHLAKERGRKVIALTGFHGEPLRSFADVSLHVNSHDYEVVEPVHDALIHRVQYHFRNLFQDATT